VLYIFASYYLKKIALNGHVLPLSHVNTIFFVVPFIYVFPVLFRCLEYPIFFSVPLLDYSLKHVKKVAKSEYSPRHICLSIWCMFAWDNWVPTESILVKFCTGCFYSELNRIFKFVYNFTKTGTLPEDVCDLMTLSRYIFRDLRKFYNKLSRENQNTHFMSHRFFRRVCRLESNSKKCKGAREVITHTHTHKDLLWFT
jgi:hypothetical protein